ncbi:hypothetical protein Tco_0481763 [Tanacetum coccineum]
MEPLDTFLMGDEVISTTPIREDDKFIKSSVDDLVLILRESELTLDSTDLECSMPVDPPLPCTDVLGDAIVDIDLPLGEHLDTLSTGDREVNFNPCRDIEELESLVVDDPVPVPRGSGPPESTPVIDESSLLVTPPPASKQLSLREVERFDPFFSLTQSGEETRVMEIPSFGFHHMPSPRPAAYSPKEVMISYDLEDLRACFQSSNHSVSDHFDPFVEIPSGESKVHIEVLSVLWGNRLPILDGSLPLSSFDPSEEIYSGESKLTWHATWQPDPVDPTVDWRSTIVDRWWSSGGPRWSATVDRRWPSLTATVDRRWPPLTGGPAVTPVTVLEQYEVRCQYEVQTAGSV